MQHKLLVAYSADEFNTQLNEHTALGWQIEGNHSFAVVRAEGEQWGASTFTVLLRHDDKWDTDSVLKSLAQFHTAYVLQHKLRSAATDRCHSRNIESDERGQWCRFAQLLEGE